MSSESQRPFVNGHTNGHANGRSVKLGKTVEELNSELGVAANDYRAEFHGDELLGDKQIAPTGTLLDIRDVFTWGNARQIWEVLFKKIAGQGLDMVAGSQLVGSLPENSANRAAFIQSQVIAKYNRMLHPPLTYMGDAFQYRQSDGKFNSVLSPHLGQAGAPYAKTVPSKTHILGAQPDPGDIFDRLMARKPQGRKSGSGLSAMLIYHATIIIHDIFRTNSSDKNISDSSSYLDLSPLYGYTDEMQRKVRDGEFKLGLLKPDTFAEDRLLRQPPGVCIMLVMYNRYHNFAARQLRRINENGRFSVPSGYAGEKLVAVARECVPAFKTDEKLYGYLNEYQEWRRYRNDYKGKKAQQAWERFFKENKAIGEERAWSQYRTNMNEKHAETELQQKIDDAIKDDSAAGAKITDFGKAYDAAWDKLDDDLFNTARLITCGIFVNISIHDYLRALMGFHRYNTSFTLDPRIAIDEAGKKDSVSRGIGNQVTVEFNLLYRFHCAISAKDEQYTEDYMREAYGAYFPTGWDPKTMTLPQFYYAMQRSARDAVGKAVVEPWDIEFGLQAEGDMKFPRNEFTRLFDDQKMVTQLVRAMEDPISNFGAQNVPRCLKAVEILGILQGRKWEVGTLNDFRDFFGMPRHKTFQSIAKDPSVQNALRDLYDHPDKVELYPGIFCEGDETLNLDPGPSDVSSTLWAAIFSDAITLVRSDRFYTVDWNTNSLTSWGMKEVTPDPDVAKGSVFHRLIQRAFPEWFPYDSVNFFHPFYTAETNAKLAKEQGYENIFKFETKIDNSAPGGYKYDCTASLPKKPAKPVILSEYAEVKFVLSGSSENFVNPACTDSAWFPKRVAEILVPGKMKPKSKSAIDIDPRMVLDYFAAVTREIVKREVITMDAQQPIYQLDVTRDLAIPVITRYVADLLGFTHRLRTEKNTKGEFSENEIYQHITNCQTFLAYGVDETKMLSRRAAFKTSMQFLFDLTESGNIRAASQFSFSSLFSWNGTDESPEAKMKSFGMRIAKSVLEQDKSAGRATATLLLVALDGAYNSVLAFSSVLDHYIDGLSKYAEAKTADAKTDPSTCEWLKVQTAALKDDPASDEEIKLSVLEAQRLSVKLPVVRKVAASVTLKDAKGKERPLKDGQVVICDVYRASRHKEDFNTADNYLAYGSSLSQGLVDFNAKETAILGLTAMIKVLAQMKNLRRGHDTQGKLKKINIDQTYEGYANFMAPDRMEKIRCEVEKANTKAGNKIFDERILKPRTETYLTPEWDEMIPFPTTWKIRFNGYGPSDYDYSSLITPRIPNDPLYQPQGASHYGGSFADVICICNEPGKACRCKDATSGEPAQGGKEAALKPAVGVRFVKGCGMPGP